MKLVVVPFNMRDHPIFHGPEPIDGMSFMHFPFTRDYKWVRSLINELGEAKPGDDEEDERNRETIRDYGLSNIKGYAVVQQGLIRMLEKTQCGGGSDSASDTIAEFMVCFCVSNAERVIQFVEGGDAVERLVV